jgi:diaminopimelate epimerase
VIYYQPTVGDRDAEVSALIFNADGSKAEMSGNGLRCLAAYLCRSGRHRSKTLRIRTVAGIKTLVLQQADGRTFRFEASMGQPIIDPAGIPVIAENAAGPLVDWLLPVDSGVLPVTVTSMGNPHCSTFWPDVAAAPVERLGPMLENHPAFPERTNVEFVQILDRHAIRARFWERGVGNTLSSGTGSSAAAVAAILRKQVESPVEVQTELGTVAVRWNPAGDLYLEGPAEFICSGTCALDDDEASEST